MCISNILFATILIAAAYTSMHKSCLREWLVQQQTCPTCRSDISAMQARQRQQDLINARNQERQEADPAAAQTEAQEGSGDAVPAAAEGSFQAALEQLVPAEGSTSRHGAEWGASSAASNRGKRVRIVTPEVSATLAPSSFRDGFDDHHDRPAFPAFYRVVQDAGAPVYNDGEAVSFVIRLIPFGVVLLGRELAWRNCDGENRLMVKIPDGWVSDDDIERIVAVPFESLH
jgi:hypothetical protein